MDDLNASQFDSLIKTAKDLSELQYSLTKNNCVDFSLNVFNSIRPSNNQIEIPNSNYSIFNIGKTPAAIYRKLNSMSSDNKVNKTLQKPVSSEGC